MDNIEGVQQHIQAAAIAKAGVKVASLCKLGDELIVGYANKVCTDKSTEKGVAFPTCISVNNEIQNVSPTEDAQGYVIRPNDVVKVELAVHISGYIASQAHTIVINPIPEVPVSDRRADVICAAKIAHEAAVRMMCPGNKSRDVTDIISKIAEAFQCTAMESTFSQLTTRYVLSGSKTFPNRHDPEEPYPNFEFEVGDVFITNVILSNGSGIARDGGVKPMVYQRDVNVKYYLKLKASQALFKYVSKQFSVFPFSSRQITDTRMKLGLSECVNHHVLVPYPSLVDKRPDAHVAQFQSTVVVTHQGPVCLTPALAMSFVHSDRNLPNDSTLPALLNQNLTVTQLPSLPSADDLNTNLDGPEMMMS
ncbi:hypothetical protein IWQ61_006234 [Dispira simplex]|nr:hypothetical protein IWQ61_006234 [Dispira simplex]